MTQLEIQNGPPRYRTRSVTRSANLLLVSFLTFFGMTDPHSAGTYFGQNLPDHHEQQPWSHYFKYLALGNDNRKIKARSIDDGRIQAIDWSKAFSMMSSVTGRRRLLELTDQYNFEDDTLDSWSMQALITMLND